MEPKFLLEETVFTRFGQNGVVNRTGSTEYAYDNNNNVIRITKTSSESPTEEELNEYDENNNLIKRRTRYFGDYIYT